jgi:hypothetical protein
MDSIFSENLKKSMTVQVSVKFLFSVSAEILRREDLLKSVLQESTMP